MYANTNITVQDRQEYPIRSMETQLEACVTIESDGTVTVTISNQAVHAALAEMRRG